MSGFVSRSLWKAVGLVGVFILSGILTNWKDLVAFREIGVKQAIINLMGSGVSHAFTGVADSVQVFFQGGGYYIIGALMLLLPWLAVFIIVDFVADIWTGLETPPHHIISGIVAFIILLFMGGIQLGFEGLFNQAETINNTTNVSNETGGLSLI